MNPLVASGSGRRPPTSLAVRWSREHLDQFTGDGRTPIPRTAVRFVDPTYRLALGRRP